MFLQHPRSNTGLVPSTHRNLLDKSSCVEKWCRLPPQPPPKIYRFKGEKQKQNRKVYGAKRCHPNEMGRNKKHYSKQNKQRNCERTNDAHPNSFTRPGWNHYLTDPTIFEEGKEDRDRRMKVKFETNSYLRNQFNQRKQRTLVEKLLDYGIEKSIDADTEVAQKRKSNTKHSQDKNCSLNRQCKEKGTIRLNRTNHIFPRIQDISDVQDQRYRIKIRSSYIFASERNNKKRDIEVNGGNTEEFFELDDYFKSFVSKSIPYFDSIQRDLENTGKYNTFVDELLQGLDV